MENIFGTGENKIDDFLYLLIALAIIVPMSFIDNITTFAKTSIFANILVILTLLVMFCYNFEHMFVNNKQTLKNVNNYIDPL